MLPSGYVVRIDMLVRRCAELRWSGMTQDEVADKTAVDHPPYRNEITDVDSRYICVFVCNSSLIFFDPKHRKVQANHLDLVLSCRVVTCFIYFIGHVRNISMPSFNSAGKTVIGLHKRSQEVRGCHKRRTPGDPEVSGSFCRGGSNFQGERWFQ